MIGGIESERQKYLRHYNSREYGHVNWGRGCVEHLRGLRPKALCDVGCGRGAFCVQVSRFIERVYGVDLASVAAGKVIQDDRVTYIDSDAKNIPLADGQVEWVTSFDCLEHCETEDLDDILATFRRVATRGAIFSIAYTPCRVLGDNLHLTVRPESWWLEKLSSYGSVGLLGKVPGVAARYIRVYFP